MGETDILQFESIVNISRLCIDWRQCGLGWAAAPAPTLNIPQLENWVVSHPTPGPGTVRDNTQTHSKYNNYLELKCVSLLSSEVFCCDDTHCVGLAPLLTADMGDMQRHAVLQTDQYNVSCSDWWYEERNIEMRDLINSWDKLRGVANVGKYESWEMDLTFVEVWRSQLQRDVIQGYTSRARGADVQRCSYSS